MKKETDYKDSADVPHYVQECPNNLKSIMIKELRMTKHYTENMFSIYWLGNK